MRDNVVAPSVRLQVVIVTLPNPTGKPHAAVSSKSATEKTRQGCNDNRKFKNNGATTSFRTDFPRYVGQVTTFN